jgi:hypothetical protein
MAYIIFIKSMRSLGEFRKNPHVKIPPKSPCANFQSLGIFKNQILFGEEFSPSLSAHPAFRPSLFFFYRPIFPPLPTGPWPSDRPSPPARPNQPPFFFLPHRSRARTAPPPAGLAPPPRSPRRLHQKRKMAASNPPSFPPIIRLHSPFNPAIEAPSSQKLRALGPPPPRLRPVKADPSHGEASHTSNDPSPSPHRALAVVLLSQGFRRR